MKNLISKAPLTVVAAVATLAITLTGCATKPTYQPSSPAAMTIITNAQGVPNYYKVQRGDTVSGIASRYRLNYRQVGALNNLDSKYTIYSGQMLKLWQSNQAPANNNPPPATAARPSYTAPASSTPSATRPAYEVTANATSGYGYPTSNQIIRNFDESSGNMGMWFAGKEGDPVLASQAGTILYSGNGLPEYGNLIMIRHSDNYITAYAHNSQLLVKEGDQVQRGQRIASMGSSGQTNQVGLQFQVRLNGNPIDPRAVLGR